MILGGGSVFKDKLIAIQREIESTNNVDLLKLVSNRLNKTFNLYVEQLELSYDRLLQQDGLRVLKKFSRER